MGKTKQQTAAEQLRDVLAKGVEDSGPIESLPPAVAGQRPKRTATIPRGATKAAAKKAAARPAPKPAKLPEAVARKLRKATAKQLVMVAKRLAFDPAAVIAAPDGDGDVLIRYVPGWEQGRMKDGKLVPGLGRQFPYLIHPDGSLSGHGYRYRSTAAEAKLKPLEEKNAARLEREAKKVAA